VTYATLPEFRDHIGVSDNVSGRDPQLTAALEAASSAIDQWCERTFNVVAGGDAASARIYRTPVRDVLRVDDIVDTTGLVVESSIDAVTWSSVASVNYALNPLHPQTGWPYTGIEFISCVGSRYTRVTARYGWSAVPAAIKTATLMQAHRLYKRISSPTGVEGVADFGPVRVSRVDPDISALIQPYRRLGNVRGIGIA
jgi:hypothetical protein